MSILVTLHVQGQVVGAREAAAAGDTFERFGAGVFPVVSGELVGPGEAPVAVLPRAAIRLLTCETHHNRKSATPVHVHAFIVAIRERSPSC